MTSPVSPLRSHPLRTNILGGVSLLVIVVLVAVFFSTRLPNNPEVTRLDIIQNLPDLLLLNLPGKGDAPGSGWHTVLQRLDILALAGGIWLAAWGLGRLVLRGLRLFPQMSTFERNLFGVSVGMVLWSVIVLGLGRFGVLKALVFRTGLLAVLAGEIALTVRRERAKSVASLPWWQRRFFTGSPVPLLVGGAVFPFLLAMLLAATQPTRDFDVREYHFGGPKEYYLQGRISFLSHNVYTSFPFLTEMFHLLGMILRGDWYRGALVGQTVLMGFVPLTGAGLLYAGTRWFSARAGWLAVLVWMTAPWAYRIGIIAYTEGGLAAFVLLSLIATLRAGEEWRVSARRYRGWFGMAGLLAGAGPACKYPGALSAAIPMFCLVAWFLLKVPQVVMEGEGKPRRLWDRALTLEAFLLGGAVAFGPWLLKNLFETGNPFYPLMYSVFGGRDWDPASHAKWQAGHPLPLGHFGGAVGFLRDQGLRFLDIFVWNDWQTPLALAVLPVAIGLVVFGRWELSDPARERVSQANMPLTRGTSGASLSRGVVVAGDRPLLTARSVMVVLLLETFWLFETWTLLSHRLDRFWVPMLPIGCWLAGIVFDYVLGRNHTGGTSRFSIRGIGVTAILGCVTLYHLGFVTSGLAGNNAYLADGERQRLLSRNMTVAELEDLPLPPRSRVLFVGEAEVFEAHFDTVYNTVFDRSIFQEWTSAGPPDTADAQQEMKPVAEIRKTLADERITHLVVNWSEIFRYRTTYGYTDYVHPSRFLKLVEAGMLEPVSSAGTLSDFEKLPADQQAEIRSFSPELIVSFEGKKLVPGVQVYRVIL